MRIAMFAPLRNKEGRKDATGAFQPEATKFAQCHSLADDKVHLFDNHDDALEMREYVYSIVDAMPRRRMDAIAFFCHGWKSGLQCGLGFEHITALSIRIKQAAVDEPKVILYACEAARDMDAQQDDDRNDFIGGAGGFADRLRDALGQIGCRAEVYAHSTAGHTTQNPYLRVFRAGESAGGKFVVAPGAELWQRWCRAMRTTTLRFRFPWMSSEEIEKEIRSAP